MTKGIFVGYQINSGGKWSGDYKVIDVKMFRDRPEHRAVHVHTIKEIFAPGPAEFPVKEGKIVPLHEDDEQEDDPREEEEAHDSSEELTIWDIPSDVPPEAEGGPSHSEGQGGSAKESKRPRWSELGDTLDDYPPDRWELRNTHVLFASIRDLDEKCSLLINAEMHLRFR